MKSSKIFLFGDAGAGKTTLCACLFHYLRRNPDLAVFQSDIENRDGLLLQLKLDKTIDKGEFPKKTEPGSVTFVNIDVNDSRNRKNTSLSFLEASGEDIPSFVPLIHNSLDKCSDEAHGPAEEVKERIISHLSASNYLLIIVAADASIDELIRAELFVSYILSDAQYSHLGIKKKRIGIVITKVDKISDAEKWSRSEMLDFVNGSSHLGVIIKQIRSRIGHGVNLFSFSVGNIDEKQVSDGQRLTINVFRPEFGTVKIANFIFGKI